VEEFAERRSRAVADPTLYLFDGYNLLHAGGFVEPSELIDRLADYVAVRGVRGVVVFDGVGVEAQVGPLQVVYAPDADAALERLAAENRAGEQVCLVSSDMAVRGTSGQEVRKINSRAFVADLRHVEHHEPEASRLRDRLDEETRARLERLRRGNG
jgi:predicted RNA-binding protein with PIN domain